MPQPPPPADCTAVVESPARRKKGGFWALGLGLGLEEGRADAVARRVR